MRKKVLLLIVFLFIPITTIVLAGSITNQPIVSFPVSVPISYSIIIPSFPIPDTQKIQYPIYFYRDNRTYKQSSENIITELAPYEGKPSHDEKSIAFINKNKLGGKNLLNIYNISNKKVHIFEIPIDYIAWVDSWSEDNNYILVKRLGQAPTETKAYIFNVITGFIERELEIYNLNIGWSGNNLDYEKILSKCNLKSCDKSIRKTTRLIDNFSKEF